MMNIRKREVLADKKIIDTTTWPLDSEVIKEAKQEYLTVEGFNQRLNPLDNFNMEFGI